jgi:anti-anti-sigma factor
MTVAFSDNSKQDFKLGYQPFFVTGDLVSDGKGGQTLAGGYYDINNQPIMDATVSGKTRQYFSDSPDGTSLLGTSRVLSVSTTTTLAILVASELARVVPGGDAAAVLGAAATLTVLVGVLLMLASLLRLGFVANFISTPVLTGFKAGIGLVILLDQLPKLLGLHISKQGFFPDLVSIAELLPHSSLITMLVAAVSLVALLGMEQRWPHSVAPLVAVGGGIAASWFFGLQAQGVSVVGAIPRGLPALVLPDLAMTAQLMPAALGIALMSFTETIAAGRAFAAPGEPPIRANRELLATGLANLTGAFIGAMPAGGGTTQTAVVRAAGGASQRTSLVQAAAAAGTMLLFAPLLGPLPNAVLAAVVMVYSAGLIRPKEFLAIRRVRTMEFRWALVAAGGVLLLGTLQGIVVAIIVSLIALLSQTAHPHVYVIGKKRDADVLRPVSAEHPDDELVEGLLILRPEGRIFFVNAQAVAEQIRTLIARYHPRVVALDMSRVTDIEYSALTMLQEGEKRTRENGQVMWLAALNPAVLEVVRRSGLADQLGRDRLLFNAREAIHKYRALAEAKRDG